MDKILTAEIKDSAYAKTLKAWQYNRGQILRITGIDLPTAVEVHFSLQETSGDTLVRVGATVDGVTEVKIPDEYLKNSGRTSDYSIYAFIYLTDETSGITKYRIEIPVNARPKPTSPSEDPEVDPDLFRETIVAVNASADRAELALKDTKEIRDKLNVDVSEKVTRPQTAEVGQVLAVKEIDADGKPTEFESKDMTGGGVSEEELKQAVDTALEETLEDAVQVGIEERTPLWTPESAQVGQLLRVKSKNDDGSVVLETVEMPSESVKDVQIDGTSIVGDGGVAEIPLCTDSNTPGLILIDPYATNGGLYRANVKTGLIRIYNATDDMISKRSNRYCPVVPENLDYAVKAAMCDGKGAVWTADEQKAARDRIGIDEYEDVLDVTLEEDSSFSADFEHEYKQLYIYIDQSGVTEKIYAVIYLYPYSYVDGEGKKINTFGNYFPSTSKAFPNVASVWKSYGKVVTRIASVINNQKESTGNQIAYLKVWDTSMLNINGIGDPFKGIYPSGTIFKAGTRIVVKGVRA